MTFKVIGQAAVAEIEGGVEESDVEKERNKVFGES